MKTIYLSLLALCWSSTVYSQYYFDYVGAGHSDGITVTSSDDMGRASGEKTVTGAGMDSKKMEASRFLYHATLGYDMDQIEALENLEFEAWIDNQFTIPPLNASHLLDSIWNDVKTTRLAQGDDPDNFLWPRVTHMNYTWWTMAMTSPSELRQKVAFALSQILVISVNSTLQGRAEGVASYYDEILEHTFGNFRDMLFDVSMHPAMGYYLSHLNNAKEDAANNVFPDENYAREIMQLFSIGLFELNQDGSYKLDSNGKQIPTYDNEDIRQLAKVFTGLGAGAVNYRVTNTSTPFFGLGWWGVDATVPMIMYDNFHDPGEKHLLNGFTIPAGQSGMTDINQAIDNLFYHENVGPFLARRMIQRMIKSNPSPEYISRVAGVFNNNGSGVRGDMKAFIKAILLDEEARSGAAMADPSSARLKDPISRLLQLTKSLPLDNPNYRFRHAGTYLQRLLRMFPLNSPTVFNFYDPDFSPNGELNANNLVAPEFKILDSYTATQNLNRTNIWTVAQRPWVSAEFANYGDPAVYLITDFIEPMAANPEEMLNHFDILYCHGQLTDRTRRVLREMAMQYGANTNTHNRTRLIMYQLFWAPDFVIMK